MRSVCWGQTVDSGATGASNLVMQPLGPRGRFLKNERQDSENLNKTDTRNMENLLGKFYVLIKCCICKRSLYAASGLKTVPVYSCVGYSPLHCIELWPLSRHGWSADFLIWCSQHLIALRAQLCSSATNASFKKSLQDTLSFFCGALLLLTFAFIDGVLLQNSNSFKVHYKRLGMFTKTNLMSCSCSGLWLTQSLTLY